MNIRDLDSSMRTMAEALQRPGDQSQALERIVVAATETIPGADYASITVRKAGGELETTATSDPLILQLDALQYQLREGPCYDAVTVDTVTHSRDLAHDRDWPRFGPRAAEQGMRSQMAVRLSNSAGTTTGLNLYSLTLGAFEDADGMPQLFASHARVALGYATELQSLQGAVGTRETIGKAIGIVMERYQLTSERAFEFLIRVSQDSNIKLRVIAAEIVEHAEKGQTDSTSA